MSSPPSSASAAAPGPSPVLAGGSSFPGYPPAVRTDDADVLHGVRVPDPYRWLESPDDPRTREWSAAQAGLFDGERSRWPAREALRARMTELLGAGAVSPPAWRGERRFWMRRLPGQEHAVLLTSADGAADRDADGTAGGAAGGTGSGPVGGAGAGARSAAERVLVDPIALDPSGTTTLDAWQPSKEGDLLAYQLSEGGTEESTLRVLDAATGEVVDGPIDRARYSPVAWLPGGRSFYYVRRLDPALVPEDERQYHRRVYLHRVGEDPGADVEIFGSGLEPTNYYGVSVSRDGRWLVVTASQGTAPRTDVWLADLNASGPAAPDLRPVQTGVDARAGLHVGRDGRLYVHTDRDAPRGRLCVTSPEHPEFETWRDLVPEDPEAVLEDFAILDGPELDAPVLLAAWTRHAVSEVTVHDLASGERTGRLELPGVGSIGGIGERPEGGPEAWFAYTDHTTPVDVLRYDARDGSLVVWDRAPGAVQVPDVVTEHVTYESKDGTPVRMFVVSAAGKGSSGADAKGPRPTILYGYGGFGVPLTPAYSAGILAWVEAGGVYAIACLRGGGEEGEGWHRAGMLGTKQNVFDDFAAAAEWLIAQGWTTAGQLGISGGSNGGLLVGAALTQRPELFRAVVCSAPLLDMVRYEKHGLGATWSSEYGAAAVAEEFAWLHAYSPYHRVREGVDYPAVLFTVFGSDTRVDPSHARKMCAALQHASAGDPARRPVLIREETEVGHGARALSRSIDLSADTLAFLAAHLGLERG